MIASWTGQLVGAMHNANVSARQLADYMGLTPEYVSMVLNGKKTPKGPRNDFERLCGKCVQTRRANERTNSNGFLRRICRWA